MSTLHAGRAAGLGLQDGTGDGEVVGIPELLLLVL